MAGLRFVWDSLLTDVAMVDEADEDFEIQGYLYASWHDQRLIGNSDQCP